MMKCAVGCVNKMAFLTEEDSTLELYCPCIQSTVTSLTHCLCHCFTFSLCDAFEDEHSIVLTYLEETGISACLYLSQYVEKSKREKGSLIKRHGSNSLAGWKGIFK